MERVKWDYTAKVQYTSPEAGYDEAVDQFAEKLQAFAGALPEGFEITDVKTKVTVSIEEDESSDRCDCPDCAFWDQVYGPLQ